jgi:histidinol-phosphate phosphatase family protein
MGKRAVFLDRDGTIAKDVHFCCRVEDLEILPHVPEAIRLLNQNGFKVVVITNQSGIGRGHLTEQTLHQIHHYMKQELAQCNACIDAIYYCPHHPNDKCECRKPQTGLLLRASRDLNIDLKRSFMVGDAERDMIAGKTMGCRTALISADLHSDGETSEPPDFVAEDLLSVALWIVGHSA